MREVVIQILEADVAILADIHGHERLAHRLPLIVNLGHNLVNQVHVVRLLALVEVFLRELLFEALLVQVEWRVDCF